MAEPVDLAAIRAEGRRLLAAARSDLPEGEWEVAQEAWEAWVDADVFPDALLAEPEGDRPSRAALHAEMVAHDWVRCPHDSGHSMTGGMCDICLLPRPTEGDRLTEDEWAWVDAVADAWRRAEAVGIYSDEAPRDVARLVGYIHRLRSSEGDERCAGHQRTCPGCGAEWGARTDDGPGPPPEGDEIRVRDQDAEFAAYERALVAIVAHFTKGGGADLLAAVEQAGVRLVPVTEGEEA